MPIITDIPIPTLRKWRKLRGYGDGAAIIKSSDGSFTKDDISRAFLKGRCPMDVYEALSKYYKGKEKILTRLNRPKKAKT